MTVIAHSSCMYIYIVCVCVCDTRLMSPFAGRLMDSHQKVGSQEMLSMIRHGANTVFSSKDTMVTEDDIDTILAKGEKKVDFGGSLLEYTG